MRHRGSGSSEWWMPAAVVAGMLCLVLALAACGQGASAKPQATSTPVPTATPLTTPTPALTVLQASGPPITGTPIAWRHANLPQGFGMANNVSALGLAASDGMTAYSCGLGGSGHTAVIVTHDHGVSWQRMADAPVWGGGCQWIIVDSLNPHIIVCCNYGNIAGTQVVSLDGGASWRSANSSYGIERVATAGSRTYAILTSSVANGVVNSLGESDDGMRTWRQIHGPFDSSKDSTRFSDLWVNPASGALLVGGIFSPLWGSADGGQHWSQVSPPVEAITNLAVQQPMTAQPWHICVSDFVCTRDGGATWIQEPRITPGNTVPLRELVGMPADGSLLVASYSKVYRLPSGATQWQDLGTIPPDSNGGVMYAPSAAGGCLWSFAAESDGAGGADPANAVYSATYSY